MASQGGLVPYKTLHGYQSGATLEFAIASGTSTDFFQGDLVTLVTGGTVVAAAAVTADQAVGVFMGCSYTGTDGTPVFTNKYTDTITSEDIVANVLVDPLQLYKIAIANSDADTTLTRPSIGSNFDIEFNTGNSTSGASGMNLDSGTAAAAGAAMLRLVGLTNDDGTHDNAGSGSTTYSHGIVMIDPNINYWTELGVLS